MQGQRHVRRRIVTLFLLGIALPSGLLGYLAFRGVRNDQALFERERREELERVAEAAFDRHDASVDALGERFRALLGTAHGDGSTSRPDAFRAFGMDEPLVDAVFGVSSEGELETFVVPAPLYRSDDARPASEGSPTVRALSGGVLASAREAELRDGDLGAALAAYETVAARASDEASRAEAINGIARIRRSQGDLDAAARGYLRLVSEFAAVPSSAVIPFGVAGRLELLRVYEQSGDDEAGIREAAGLFRRLLRAEHDLTSAQYAFVADRGRSAAETFLEGAADDGEIDPAADSLRALLEVETLARARQERVDRFRDAASRDPAISGRRVGPESASGLRREVVRIDGTPHYVLVAEPAVSADGSTPGEWALLLNPAGLRRLLEAAVREVTAPSDLGWALRDDAGALVAGATPGEGDLPTVTLIVPDRFPALDLQVFALPAGAVESFFTSPRSVYLYLFVLVAGLLAFGLVFTVRTLTHQLALSRMQSDFVSTVSHEFKSPVTAIRQLAEMLQSDRVPTEDRRRRYYDVLVEQSERLTALMDHILDFAKMDAGYIPQREELDPGSHLEEVANRVQQRVRHQGFTVRREIAEGLPRVRLDPDAIALAVTNLIDNGIKYSGEAREVIVRAATENGDLAIAVQDFGVGLDPADREHVFERFYRGGSPLTRSVKGTGLGLTLVKQIVDAHGGSIDVRSRPGEGSTFTIRIPTGTT